MTMETPKYKFADVVRIIGLNDNNVEGVIACGRIARGGGFEYDVWLKEEGGIITKMEDSLALLAGTVEFTQLDGTRKVIQIATAPLNTFIDDQGATGTVNAVLVVCDDGTVWIQMLGDGSEGGWLPVNDVPQGDFDELNAASNKDAASEE